MKLAAELSKVATGQTLYILDEPTTGLHFADIQRLLEVLERLVAAGNTVVVIEHNLDVIKVADQIIDLGPEGGEEGGQVIAIGTPEKVATVAESYTGAYLAEVLPVRASRAANGAAKKTRAAGNGAAKKASSSGNGAAKKASAGANGTSAANGAGKKQPPARRRAKAAAG